MSWIEKVLASVKKANDRSRAAVKVNRTRRNRFMYYFERLRRNYLTMVPFYPFDRQEQKEYP